MKKGHFVFSHHVSRCYFSSSEISIFEMMKNDICLRGVRKQNATFFIKCSLNNALMPQKARTGSERGQFIENGSLLEWVKTCFFVCLLFFFFFFFFFFFILNIYTKLTEAKALILEISIFWFNFVSFTSYLVTPRPTLNHLWRDSTYLSRCYQLRCSINFKSFMTDVPIIWKSVHRFAEQINGLVSIW